MRHLLPLVVVSLVSFTVQARPQLPRDPYDGLPDPRIAAMLKTLHGTPGRTDLPPRDGRFLYEIVLQNDLKAGLEISTSGGCSSLWLGLALQQTGGNLKTIEPAGGNGSLREILRRAGLQERIGLVPGNASRVIPDLAGPFDFVFLDARKQDYEDLLAAILPKVRPGGIIVAHDINARGGDQAAFLRSITGNPDLKTELLPGSGTGMSISRKLR